LAPKILIQVQFNVEIKLASKILIQVRFGFEFSSVLLAGFCPTAVSAKMDISTAAKIRTGRGLETKSHLLPFLRQNQDSTKTFLELLEHER
jgi:hypothetical protein